MRKLLRKIKHKITQPSVMRHTRIAGERTPRKRSSKDHQVPTVYKMDHLTGIDDVFQRTETLWEKCIAQDFLPGHRILIKINLNTADPYPASTSPQFLLALVDFLHRKGLKDIQVGDCSSISALPTQRVADQLGIPALLGNKADMVFFDQEDWIKVQVGGKYLQEVLVPESIYKADRVIYLANLKCHHLANFSLGMKLGVGMMHPRQRYSLHEDHLAEKLVEINLAVEADWTIIDGRQAMISGGPINGQVEASGTVIMGTDPLAVDIEAYRVMYQLKKAYDCLDHFQEEPFTMPQFRHARRILPEGQQWQGYHLERM